MRRGFRYALRAGAVAVHDATARSNDRCGCLRSLCLNADLGVFRWPRVVKDRGIAPALSCARGVTRQRRIACNSYAEPLLPDGDRELRGQPRMGLETLRRIAAEHGANRPRLES
jgi:hypothetical protein